MKNIIYHTVERVPNVEWGNIDTSYTQIHHHRYNLHTNTWPLNSWLNIYRHFKKQ